MSDLSRKRTGWLVAFGVSVIGIFAFIAASLELDDHGTISHAGAKAATGETAGTGHGAGFAHATAATATDGEAAKKDDPDAALRATSCFDCHDLKAYHEGNKDKKKAPARGGDDDENDDEDEDEDEDSVIGKPFSHDLHAEEVGGHCHKCHAFKGHFQVVIREETCGECH